MQSPVLEQLLKLQDESGGLKILFISSLQILKNFKAKEVDFPEKECEKKGKRY